MAEYTTTIHTPWEADKAFDYMADLRNFEEWDPGVSKAEMVKGAAPGLGSEFDVKANGADLRYEIVEYRRPTEVLVEAKTTFFTSRDRITVSEAEHGSRVTYDAILELNGPLGLLDPLLKPFFHRIGSKAAEGLAKKLDATSQG